MLKSMLRIKFTVWLLWEAELLKYRCTVRMYAYMQPVSNDHGRVWLCFAAHCSQDAFNFLIFSLALPKTSGYWQESSSDIFCENPTCNM